MPWTDVKPGGELSTRELNDLAATVDSLALVKSQSIEVRRGPGGFALEARKPVTVLARTTSTSGTGGDVGKYDWEEVYLDSGGTVVATPGGQSGTKSSLPARELRLNANVASGTLIELTLDPSGTFYTFDVGNIPDPFKASFKSGGTTYTTNPATEIRIYDPGAGYVTFTNPSTGLAQYEFQPASASNGGYVTHTGFQAFAGDKSFSGDVSFTNNLRVSSSNVNSLESRVDLGGATVATIGSVLGYGRQACWRDIPSPYIAGYWDFFYATQLVIGGLIELQTVMKKDQWSAVYEFDLNRGDYAGSSVSGVTAWCHYAIDGIPGETATIAGMKFTGGLYTGGTATVVTSVDGDGGTTGLTFSGGPITDAGSLTLGGTLVPANGGTGLTSTPPAGTFLTGTGSGYEQTPAHTMLAKWSLTV